MIVIKNIPEWSPSPYAPDLPPPLCFTVPAGDRYLPPVIIRGGVAAVTPRKPKLMMDPLDRGTWQRPYRFT